MFYNIGKPYFFLFAPGVCVFTTTVCMHLDELNAEHKIPNTGHRTWLHVTFKYLFLMYFNHLLKKKTKKTKPKY